MCALPSAALSLNAQLYWDFEPPSDTYTGEAFSLKEIFGQDAIGEADRVVVEGDDFVLAATGEPVRFWGVNINANSNSANAAALYAKRGVNAARYHSSKAIVDSGNPNGYLQISQERLDKLHQAIANYSQEGIYLFLSETFFPLSFNINPAWGIDGYDQAYVDGGGTTRAYFVLFFDEDLKVAYKGWLQQMVGAVNPYNGLSIADDPAVATIELVNEDNLFFWSFNPSRVPAVQWRKVEGALCDFVVEKYGTIAAARAQWGNLSSRFDGDRDAEGRLHVIPAGGTNISSLKPFTENDLKRVADQMEFLATTQRDWFAEMTGVLRESGFQGGVIASNWKTSDSDAATSGSYLHDIEYWTYTAAGVLDNHHYFSPVKAIYQAGGSTVVGDQAYAPPAVQEPRRLSVAVKQAEGHPSAVSEFSWTAPNTHRPEAAAMISAYSALNGVDALFWFTSEGEHWDSGSGIGRWPLNVPSKLGLFPATSLLYRRGDVAPSPVLVREGKRPQSLYTAEPSLIKSIQGWDISRDAGDFNFNPETGEGAIDSLAILAGRADIAFDTDVDFVHPDLNNLFSEEDQFVKSFTGQLETDFGAGLMTVDTPFAKGITGFLAGAGTVTLGEVRLRGNNDFGSLLLVSLDGLPIAQSARLLIQYGTRDQPTGWTTTPWFTTVGSQNVTGIEVTSLGGPPWQVQEADGRVILGITDRAVQRAVSLDPNLKVQATLRTLASGSGITITLPKDALYTLVELEPAANLIPVITSRGLPNAMVGEAYTARLTAAGGDGLLQWSGGDLPQGLSLSADGVISGIPSFGGGYSLEVTVSDGDGDADTRQVPLQVLDLSGSGPDSPWVDLPSVNGWKSTPIGWLADAAWPFVYHNNHQWMWFSPISGGRYYALNYRDDLGWLYLDDSMYPLFLYSYQYARWLLFTDGSGAAGSARWFFDYTGELGDGGWFTPGDT